ncbi:nucleoside-diphosphate sugar epimerase/dehydratase, partial [Tamilnaduibacter salinus]|uniref:nucleoside-diphosphate sugar epimerase/dehydratase n=1 Tax=Tamilnaduibacter salinus TaxID=1484056 RepID=UPI002AE030F2
MLTVAFTIGVFTKLGLYRAVIRYMSDRALLTIIGGVLLSATCLIVLGYLFQVLVPRSVPVLYGALAFMFVGGTRLAVRMLVSHSRKHHLEPVAIVGVGPTGLQLASALIQGTEYRPVLFLTTESSNHKTLISGLPVFNVEHVESALRKHAVDRILLALDDSGSWERRSLIARLESLSVPVQTVPSMSELVAGQARINDIRDLDVEDLLGRDPVTTDSESVARDIKGKSVMVTGAGGSIGSELCRQILRHR